MCLVTRQKKALVAKKDIIVYKAVNRKLGSAFYTSGIVYDVGSYHESEIVVEKEFKSFFDNTVEDSYPDKFAKDLTHISKGLHSMTGKRFGAFSKKYPNYYLFIQCTIPMGAEYYKDNTGLYVSDKLIVNKIIEV